MYIYIFLLRMTDTMTSQNTDLSFWNILYTFPTNISGKIHDGNLHCPHSKDEYLGNPPVSVMTVKV
jgi:hypothetical protein